MTRMRFEANERGHHGPNRVRIVEVGPRDGLQNIATTVPTSVKVELIQRLVRTGLPAVEVTSFVSPRWIPQLADNKEVLRGIGPLLKDAFVSLSVLVPNVKGLNGALQCEVREVAVFISASEGFSRKNTNCSVSEALSRAREVATRAKTHGIAVRGYVSCILECPYDGPTPPSSVLRVARELLDMGCYEVSLGETLGVGTAADVEALLSTVLESIPPTRLAGHFHDTGGQALANVMKAYEMGLRTFDCSIAGLGGCPYAKTSKGNVPTEDVVHAFEKLGVSTGINLEELVDTGRWISGVLDQPNGSRTGGILAIRLPESQAGRDATAPRTSTRCSLDRSSERFTFPQSGRGAKGSLTQSRTAV